MSSEPLPYHVKIRDFFKGQPGIWSFYSATRQRDEQLTNFKTDLLKNTYQFHPESDPVLYEKIHIAREKLGLNALPVTAYQALTNDPELNASIVCLSGEAHMVLSGGVLQILDEKELLALAAHELAHVKLNALLEGELETADRIIMAIANSPDSSAAQYETARLFRLYTEIYCDREAYSVLGDATPVITMLLKMATGLSVVHAESYIRQAEEIFSGGGKVQSGSLTHPENFIRARALAAGSGPDADAIIAQMIEGDKELDRLDVMAQQELSSLTEELLYYYLRPEWFRTAPVVSLASQYFSTFKPGVTSRQGGMAAPGEAETGRLKTYLDKAHESIREYFAYVLLDFALADPELEDVPAGYALQVAESCGISDVFEAVIKKELAYSDKQWEREREQMRSAFASVEDAERS